MPAQVQPAPVEAPRVRPQSVLFACTLNTVRSPMAEALARHYFGREIYFASAGLKRGEPDGFAMAAMEEIGVDITRYTSEMDDHIYLQKVREHIAGGRRCHLRATPAFFVNGVFHDVSFGMQALHDAVAALLHRPG